MQTNLQLVKIKMNDNGLRAAMQEHYSQPKGFVGRRIIYAVLYNDVNYGFIAGGSPTLNLAGRNEFFEMESNSEVNNLLVNNTFFHISKVSGIYPVRNFSSLVIKEWRVRIIEDWYNTYKISLIGYETLVELPRTGELYLRNNWTQVGVTKGFTCKRISSNLTSNKTDNWSGQRVWDTKNLRPKLVFCKKLMLNTEQKVAKIYNNAQ
jgi:hypothetical protein